jgi:glutathione S-transferase
MMAIGEMQPQPPQLKLYVILGSHACRATKLMLAHKRLSYTQITVPTGFQRAMPLFGFPGGTVPALVIDGRHVQTNIAIARALDELQPEPPLFPNDPGLRAQVEQAERWADDVFQMSARRTVLAASLHGPEALTDRGGVGRLGPLLWQHDRSRYICSRMLGPAVFNVTKQTEPGLLAELPSQLDKIDAWIGAGVLSGEQLNAADFAIGSSLALLSYRRDLVADLESRPLFALIERLLPVSAGSTTLPAPA